MQPAKMAEQRDLDVVVVGSCFVDMLCYVPRIPQPGETIRGDKFQLDFGGKASNQCIMAAKLGAQTAMVAKVGCDQFGKDSVKNFQRYGVNTDHILFTDEASTGITSIAVDKDGQPSFISMAGSNRHLTAEDIATAKEIIASSPVLVCDKGIPLPICSTTLKLGTEVGSKTIFNPSPKLEKIEQSIYPNTFLMVLNADEGESLTGIPVTCIETAKKVIMEIHDRGTANVVLTLGAKGAVCSEKNSSHLNEPQMTHIKAKTVEVVDTTGAGDALIGALAFYLACYSDLPFPEMVQRSVDIATHTVTSHGVQSSYPAREQLSPSLFV